MLSKRSNKMNCRKLFRVVCFISLVLATAFAVQQKPYPVVTETKDDVKTVTNPDYPRDGRFVAKLTEEMSCGEEGGPEAGVLNKPFRLDTDPQGNVYVMDFGDTNIKIYDREGRFLRAIGRKGQGPGEFGGMVFFSLMTDGRLGVLDFVQHRVIIIATDGQYITGFPLDGFFGTMAIDGRDRLFLGKRGAVKEPDQLSTELQEVPYITSIFRTDASGKELVHLTDFLGESIAMKAMGGGTVVSSGGLHTIVWNVSREGKLYGGYNLDYRIDVFGEDGKKEFTFGRKFTPIKNPRYKGLAGQKKILPAYRTIITDEEGSLWVEITQDEDAKGILYDVFSGDGTYCKQVAIDQRIGVFKNGKIYCLLRPEEGYPSVKRYKLELVPTGK